MPNKHLFLTSTQRHQALLSRDPLAHSSFIYSVITTKIYCRPTCPSRLARRANIVFHESAEEAEKDGFRACRRCRPDIDMGKSKNKADDGAKENHKNSLSCDTQNELRKDDLGEMGRGKRIVDKAMKLIEDEVENGDQKWTVKKMAKEVGLTESHFCRIFKRETGATMGEFRMKVIGRNLVEMTKSDETTEDWIVPINTEMVFNWDNIRHDVGGITDPSVACPYVGIDSALSFDVYADDGMEFLNLDFYDEEL